MANYKRAMEMKMKTQHHDIVKSFLTCLSRTPGAIGGLSIQLHGTTSFKIPSQNPRTSLGNQMGSSRMSSLENSTPR